MFYGVPAARREELQQALTTLADIYKGEFYCNDMLICLWRNMSFLQDKKFMACYREFAADDVEESLLWRLHTLAWAVKNAFLVEGDFVECGVFKGFCSAVILKYVDFQNELRQAYLYDTYEGLPETTSTDEERKAWDYTNSDGDQGTLYNKVCRKFSQYHNVKVIRGVVPDSFEQGDPEKIAFLHIDMNSEQAEMLALEHLFDKVTAGGIIVLDDFGWSCNVNQMRSELAFMNERCHPILELPTGQGVVIKHA
jgi:hypothetical protein